MAELERNPSILPAASSDVPSTQRMAVRGTPTEWLDRLLAAMASLRPSLPLAEIAAHLLDSVTFALEEDVAIGVCIPGGETGQIIVRRMPTSRTDNPEPSRLFPTFAFEQVVMLPHDDGATLHLAADEEERLSAPSAVELVERLSSAMGSALRHGRSHERARAQTLELDALRGRIIQSDKLASLGQIAAGIVHELNNPLTSIVAYSEYLRRKAERSGHDPADVERLARIYDAAQRILRFSRDLTAYSRPSNEVPVALSIHDVIDRALIFCEHLLDATGIMVERNFGEIAPIRGVQGPLTQVFVNLFTNAAHAMQEGGCLSISTAMQDDRVLITITDDGHGIEVEHLPRIFDPFFTTKTDGSGTGLGLSIVRDIIATHGGRIRATKHAPRGTAFVVELLADLGGGDFGGPR
jgi:C4-dicarboxylate-specific signal transduction histidine kinase